MNLWQLIGFPFALLYGIITSIRNFLYNKGILKSTEFDIPVISVGNLSMGGTGKTPHVEYMIRLLQANKYKVAILSRGYKRKTRGFYLADSNTVSEQIGDESFQIYTKFKNLVVAVDEDRVHGIKTLLHTFPDLDVILLDDAFQHRNVKPGLSLLLTDFHDLFTNDYMFPSGTLREPRRNYARADVIIITKTHKVLSPITRRRLDSEIKPKNHQKLFHSYIKYAPPEPITPVTISPENGKYSSILLIAGIANPYPLEYYLHKKCHQLELLQYRDHHEFTVNDVKNIREAYLSLFSKNKVMYTTEKDAVRLNKPELMEYLIDLPLYKVPIAIQFRKPEKENFDELVLNFVEGKK